MDATVTELLAGVKRGPGGAELAWVACDDEATVRRLLALKAARLAELGRRVVEANVSPGAVDRPAYYGWMVSGEA